MDGHDCTSSNDPAAGVLYHSHSGTGQQCIGPLLKFNHTSFGLTEQLETQIKLAGEGRPGSAGRDRGVDAGKVKRNEHQLSQPKGQGALSFPDAVAFLPPLCVLTYLHTPKD